MKQPQLLARCGIQYWPTAIPSSPFLVHPTGLLPSDVLDTHALIWAVTDDGRLGRRARVKIEETAQTDRVAISAITPWEIAMLVEKSRLRLGQEAGLWIEKSLSLPGIYRMPIEPAIATDSVRLPGDFHADPADRIIISTARYCNASLVTADSAMLTNARIGHVQAIDARA